MVMQRSGATCTSGLMAMACALLLGASVAVHAHHSFAVFFDDGRTTTVQGTVTEFHFRNPHGMIAVQVDDKSGGKVIWKAETNSPSIMARRGWNKQSVRVGEQVTIDGWPARDGSRYLRIRSIKGPDGKPIGVPLDTAAEQR
jgi:Family of unknown function (DUF6152)